MREYWLDPPEYDDPREAEDSCIVDVLVDCDIAIDKRGTIKFDSYEWAKSDLDKTGRWLSDEYDIDVSDRSLDDILDLVCENIPTDEPGTYHIKAYAIVYYNISNIFVYETFEGVDEDGDPSYSIDGVDADDAEIELDKVNSEFKMIDFYKKCF